MADKKDREPTIRIRLVGGGIWPEKVSVSQMCEVVNAVQCLASGKLHLVRVERRSAGYLMHAADAENVGIHLQRSGQALETPEKSLQAFMMRHFDKLSSIVNSLGCTLEVSSLISDWTWTIAKDRWKEIKSRTLIHDETSVSGSLQRVGGATVRKCAIRCPDRTRLLIAKVASNQIARSMGKCLYANITARGMGTFFVRDWSLIDLTINDFSLRKKSSFDDMYQAMREASGGGWDQIKDPVAFLKEMR